MEKNAKGTARSAQWMGKADEGGLEKAGSQVGGGMAQQSTRPQMVIFTDGQRAASDVDEEVAQPLRLILI